MFKAKILLVDDARIFLDIEKDFLRFSPVQILTAYNGADALEIVRSERPDLVVMDVNMPHMDGISCCLAIKNEPKLSSTPVILVITRSGKDDMASYRAAGCDATLHKPLQRREFLNSVFAFLPVIERREPRVPCRMAVTVETGAGSFRGMGLDIAVNGLYIAADCEFECGSDVVVSFRIPTADNRVTVIWGRVAWLNKAGEGATGPQAKGFGVEFLEITGQDGIVARANELASYVSAHSSL
jgi:CheY-like chemotaxis protein